MKELPKAYEKYDETTQEALSDLLESIEHITHILKGIEADILNGSYHEKQAQLDSENFIYSDGVDVFSSLECVAECGWLEKENEEVA
jgi:hypothetical protein